MSFFDELKRRNVIRVTTLYVVTSWLVLQIADVLFPAFGIPEWAFRFVAILMALGFIPAIVFSWAYEITPEGIKKEKDVDRSRSITPNTGKRIDRLTAGLLVVLIVVVLGDRFMPRDMATPSIQASPSTETTVTTETAPSPTTTHSADPRSIAVLPFTNMSADPEQEYFSDGLADSLLHLLAQVQELRVAARTSSFQFKGHTGNMADIGKTLGVANVLEGSVRRSGNTIRITAQLIKVDDGFHLWSGTYDRTLDDVFAIQDEIAEHVAEALKVALLGKDAAAVSSRETSIDAYDQYLKGLQQLAVGSYESLPEAKSFFTEAIDRAPDYLPAYLGLAETHNRMGNTGQQSIAEASAEITRLAQFVIERDPGSAKAHALLALADAILYFPAGSGVAELEFRRAMELDPRDATVLQKYGFYLAFMGKNPIPIFEQALEIDPLSSNLLSRLSLTSSRMGLFEEGLYYAKRLKVVHPDNPNGTWSLFQAQRGMGLFVEAYKSGILMEAEDPEDYEGPASTAMNLLDLGLLKETEAAVQRAEVVGPGRPMPTYARIALLHQQGDLEAAGELAIEALVAGIDGRHWGPFVMNRVGVQYAIQYGQEERYLKALSDWLSFDLLSPEVSNWINYFAKVGTLPILQATGHDELAGQIIVSARAFLSGLESGQRRNVYPFELEMAAGNHDAAVDVVVKMVADRAYSFWWVGDWVLEPISDDPRFQKARQTMQSDLDRMRAEVEREIEER